VTGTNATAATDIRLYPRQPVPPKVSNLNVAKGATCANLAVVKLSDLGRVLLRNNAGSVHLIADLAGYFVNA
jgi:hypothetical protein